ncbi:MAG: RHS repeat-associated core domain-containing protein [Chloroflexota bacterium]
MPASLRRGTSTWRHRIHSRYDPYGETLAQVSSGLASPFRYQGRLLLSDAGDAELYDFVLRAYAPDLGSFSAPDDLAGSALNPITFNRYLYAGADPATLVDPDGHWPWDDIDPLGFAGQVAGNVGSFAYGFGEGAVGAVVGTGQAIVAAGGCALDGACRSVVATTAAAAVGRFGQDLSRDAGGTLTGVGRTVVGGVADTVGGAVTKVGNAWSSGDFRTLGAMAGETAVVVAGSIAAGGAIGALRAGTSVTAGAANALLGAGRTVLGAGRAALGAGRRFADGAIRAARDVPRLAGVAKETAGVVRTQLPPRSTILRVGPTQVPVGGTMVKFKSAIRIGTAPTYKGAYRLPFGIHVVPRFPFVFGHINPWSKYFRGKS